MRFPRRGAALVSSAAVLAFPLVGCGSHGDNGSGAGATAPTLNASDAVATVNGQTITQAEFFTSLQNYAPNPQAPAQAPAGRTVLQQMINSLCLIGLAQQQGVAPTDTEVEAQYNNFKMLQDAASIKPLEDRLAQNGLTPQEFKDLQVRPQLAQLKLITKGTPPPTDAQVKAYYDQHKADQFTKPERAHIKVIVLANQSDAQQIYQQIQSGKPFDTFLPRSLNKAFEGGEFPQWVSLDAAKNPALGPIIDSIKSLNSGQTTKPFAFGGGWWLAEMVEKKPQEIVTLDQVKGLIPFFILEQSAQPTPTDTPAAQQQKQQKAVQLQQDQRDFETKLASGNGIKINLPGIQYTALLSDLKNPPPPPPAPTGFPAAPGPAARPAPPAGKR